MHQGSAPHTPSVDDAASDVSLQQGAIKAAKERAEELGKPMGDACERGGLQLRVELHRKPMKNSIGTITHASIHRQLAPHRQVFFSAGYSEPGTRQPSSAPSSRKVAFKALTNNAYCDKWRCPVDLKEPQKRCPIH